jgi:hypothetical protein
MAERCVAMTIETVYSKGGFDHYVTENDVRDLGAAVTRSIYDYFSVIPTARNALLRPTGSGDPGYDIPDEIENKQ